MKLAHSAVVTPKRAGLYETTRELVFALRKEGLDSRIVDPTIKTNKLHPGGEDDRGAKFAPIEWAKEADFIINHSGLGNDLENLAKPVIHIAHGRPRSSFLLEAKGSTPVYSYQYHKNKDPKFLCVVTFWPQHVPYLKVMFPDKPVHYVNPPVDLSAWTPNGPNGYNFGGKKGEINCVITDAWREDIDPFEAMMSFALWARTQKGAKLHLYGNNKKKRGFSAIVRRIRDDGNMGEWLGWVSGLDNIYRSANMLITPHIIDTRTIREAKACGCPVVRIQDIWKSQTRMTIALNVSRQAVRKEAEKNYNPQNTAMEFIKIVKGFGDK